MYKRATSITNICVMEAMDHEESRSNFPLFGVHQGTQQMSFIPGECQVWYQVVVGWILSSHQKKPPYTLQF